MTTRIPNVTLYKQMYGREDLRLQKFVSMTQNKSCRVSVYHLRPRGDGSEFRLKTENRTD